MKERKVKAMLVMPVIITPFIVLICWVLGLVGSSEAKASGLANGRGINLNLPAAIPTNDSSWDKLHFYEQADKDSAKLMQLRKQDPYLNDNKLQHDPLAKYSAKVKFQPYPDEALNQADEEERKVYEKISAIHKEIDRPPLKKKFSASGSRSVELNKNNDVDRLERMMQMMNDKEPEEDPEMREIQQLMESIKDIQHPDRVSERLKKEEVKLKAYDVQLTRSNEVKISDVQTNRFYSMNEAAEVDDDNNGIKAVVHETQMIASGDLVKMRLMQNVFVNSEELPANSFVFGEAKINANRINMHISFVQANGEFFPVSLDVIGHDGMPGIPVVASKASMAAAQTADKSAQGINMMGVDNNLGAQVAGAAIQTGKQLLKKQIKVMRYSVPAGYQVQLVSSVN